MFDIPTVLHSKELLDKAFHRASKVQISDHDYRFRMSKINTAKVDSAASVIDSTLSRYVNAFPSFDNIPPFYLALIDLLFSVDRIRKSLGRIDGVRKQVLVIGSKTIRQIRRTKKPAYMAKKREEAYGRISSLVDRIDGDLRFLDEVRLGMRKLPSIPTKHPTVVVAGYPSVGKSQLINNMSTADTKVAAYPFTSHDLTVGYFNVRRRRYQMVDTPGLLDRPFKSRNVSEKKAILALSLLTDLCIYIVDPTEHCGFELEPQLKLLSSLSEAIPSMSFIVCRNKADLPEREGNDLKLIGKAAKELGPRHIGTISISAKDGQGLEELREMLVEAQAEKGSDGR